MQKTTPFEEFLRGYKAALLWSSTVEADGTTYTGDEVDRSSISQDFDETCLLACKMFYKAHEADIDNAARLYDISSGDGADTGYDFAGHDFALTRNRHGVGFSDRHKDLTKALAQRLTAASHEVGECDLYLGDDELLYVNDPYAHRQRATLQGLYLQHALAHLASDELEINEDAKVSLGSDDGAWVEARVWVPESSLSHEQG